MKIAVVGPGAMGTFFAWSLARAGLNVTLLDRDSTRARYLSEQGVSVATEESEPLPVHVPVETAAQATQQFDAAFFFVKAYDTVHAALEMQRCLSVGATVISLQNGLGNGPALAGVLEHCPVLTGTTGHGVTLAAPGACRHAGAGATVLGPHAEATRSDCNQVAALLSTAGIETRVVDDPELAIWEKVCINAAINPLTALLQVTNGALAEPEVCRDLMARIVEECVAAAGMLGVALDAADRLEATWSACAATAANHSSMLQDIRGGKRTEIEQINGAVVQVARSGGFDAVANRVLAELVLGLSKRPLE